MPLSRSIFAFCVAITVITASLIMSQRPAFAQNGGNGQFLSTYLGPTTATDLLVNSSTVTFNGTEFALTSALGAPVGTTTGGFYVWGVNRGAGTAGFAGLGATLDESNVLFDTVIVAHPVADSITLTPSLVVNRLGGGGSTVLPVSNMTFSGNVLRLVIPLSALPSTGFQPLGYGFNLWPRFQGTFNGNNVTGNAQISQFAPNNATFQAVAAAAPEPSSLLLVVGSLAVIRLLPGRQNRRLR
jgi:hypothetical protein